MPFKKILDESNRKPNKIWVDKGSEFYNRSMKTWLEMNSTHNEGTDVVAERFIRAINNKICKYMTATSKNVYMSRNLVSNA